MSPPSTRGDGRRRVATARDDGPVTLARIEAKEGHLTLYQRVLRRRAVADGGRATPAIAGWSDLTLVAKLVTLST